METLGQIVCVVLAGSSVVALVWLIADSFEKTTMRLHKLFFATLIVLGWMVTSGIYGYTQLNDRMDRLTSTDHFWTGTQINAGPCWTSESHVTCAYYSH